MVVRARDVMTRPVVSITEDTSLRQVITVLTEHGFGALPVVDDEERVIGILSESDALRASEHDGEATKAAEIMKHPVEVVGPDMDVSLVAKHMVASHLRCVPVVDKGILVGVVARRDLLRMLVRSDDVIDAQVRALLAGYSGNRPRWTAEVADGHVTITGSFDDEAERRVVAALARTVPGVRGVDLRVQAAAGR